MMKVKIKQTNNLNGVVKISGSKNAALAIVSAAIISKENIVLYNVPNIEDIRVLLEILNSIGVEVKYYKEKNKLFINAKNIINNVKTNLVTKLRASYYLMGAIISRKKHMSINFPGGCNFVSRPIELHLKAFKLMNIEVEATNKIKLTRKRYISSVIDFPVITVGGTVNAILASVLNTCETVITNAAIEPEVLDMINFLNKIGASIIVKNNREIHITGVKKLRGGSYKIMFDRIEAGSYLFLAASHPLSIVTITDVKPQLMSIVLTTLKQMGCKITIYKNKIKLESPTMLNGINLKVGPYPMFPTDLQPIVCASLIKANTKSIIEDLVYIGRNSHINELKKLSADINVCETKIVINPNELYGDIIKAHDLRCAFSLIIATSISKGMSIIEDIDYIYRGYENIENKLRKLSVNIDVIV